MRKYIVEDSPLKGNGDYFQKVFDTLDEANDTAKKDWAHLTRTEKMGRRIRVGYVEDTTDYLVDEAWDDDGNVDYTRYHSFGVGLGYFDSDN